MALFYDSKRTDHGSKDGLEEELEDHRKWKTLTECGKGYHARRLKHAFFMNSLTVVRQYIYEMSAEEKKVFCD